MVIMEDKQSQHRHHRHTLVGEEDYRLCGGVVELHILLRLRRGETKIKDQNNSL